MSQKEQLDKLSERVTIGKGFDFYSEFIKEQLEAAFLLGARAMQDKAKIATGGVPDCSCQICAGIRALKPEELL